MRYVIENVPPEVHEEFGKRSLMHPCFHPKFPCDLHLDMKTTTEEEVLGLVKRFGADKYVELTPGKRVAKATTVGGQVKVSFNASVNFTVKHKFKIAAAIAAAGAASLYFLS